MNFLIWFGIAALCYITAMGIFRVQGRNDWKAPLVLRNTPATRRGLWVLVTVLFLVTVGNALVGDRSKALFTGILLVGGVTAGILLSVKRD